MSNSTQRQYSMYPFIHKEFIGDFFDILEQKSPLASHISGVCTSLFGATTNQEAVVSRFFGDLALPHSSEFAASLDSLLSGPVRLVVLDFSGVTSFCRNAAGALVNFAASVQCRKKQLVLYSPGKAVLETLEQLNIRYLFAIMTTENELLLAIPD